MVLEDISKQKIGYLAQTAKLTDPIDTVDVDYYRFGLNERSIGLFPTMESEVSTQYYGNERKPRFGRVVAASLSKPMTFNPTNMIYWGQHWGGATHAGAEPNKVHTIKPSLIGIDLPYFATRWQTDSIYRVALDTRIRAATINFVRDQRLSAGINISSKKVINTDVQADHTPIYPGDNGDPATSEDGMYLLGQGDGMAFKWDVTLDGTTKLYVSGGQNYSDYLISFNFASMMMSQAAKDANALYYEFYEGQFAFSMKGSILRMTDADHDQIYTDLETQRDDQVWNDAHFKIFNGTTKYMQIDMEDVILTKCELNHVPITDSKDKAQLYDFEAIVLSPIITGIDGVHSDFYPTTT